MEDPVEAKERRGAHWTFNADAFVASIEKLRRNKEEVILLPSFDHGVGDPVENSICVPRATQVVIVEGNYLLIGTASYVIFCLVPFLWRSSDVEPWNRVVDLMDETWFAECDLEIAMQRVYRRHLATGKAPDVARRRITHNDRLNAKLVHSFAFRANLLFNSDF